MKHYKWGWRSCILVMHLRDIQLTGGTVSAMLQMPWTALFVFLGWNNVLHSYSKFLQNTPWVPNKLVSFITVLKVGTKKQVDEAGFTEESGTLVKIIYWGITSYNSSTQHQLQILHIYFGLVVRQHNWSFSVYSMSKIKLNS